MLKYFTGRKGVKQFLMGLKRLMKERVKFHYVLSGDNSIINWR